VTLVEHTAAEVTVFESSCKAVRSEVSGGYDQQRPINNKAFAIQSLLSVIPLKGVFIYHSSHLI